MNRRNYYGGNCYDGDHHGDQLHPHGAQSRRHRRRPDHHPSGRRHTPCLRPSGDYADCLNKRDRKKEKRHAFQRVFSFSVSFELNDTNKTYLKTEDFIVCSYLYQLNSYYLTY